MPRLPHVDGSQRELMGVKNLEQSRDEVAKVEGRRFRKGTCGRLMLSQLGRTRLNMAKIVVKRENVLS
jgi:hypothetical protein